MSLIAGKGVAILFLDMVDLLTKLLVRSFYMFWNDTCDSSCLQYPVFVCMLYVCSCMSVNCQFCCRGEGNFNEREQRLKICFRWHPPKGCF